MKKILASCVLTAALFLVSTTAVLAQSEKGFTIQPPRKNYVELVPDGKLDLPNVADLNAADLKSALQSGCKSSVNKDLTFCRGWSGAFCTGTAVLIPCGFQATGIFGSLQTGCTSSWGRRSDTNQLFHFVGFPDNTCITPNGTTFNLVACTNP